MPHKILLAVQTVLMFLTLNSFANLGPVKKSSRQDYIERYSKIAIKEMNEYGIPASITLAQACLESGDGNSRLARMSNNHFGIKCKSSWTGEKVYHDDDEKGECFRKYNSPVESFNDHSKFLVESSRYKFLFDYHIRDYKQWAHGLKKAGYATNPKYADLLIKIIEDYKLDDLDRYYKSADGHRWRNKSRSESMSARIIKKRNRNKAFFAEHGDTYENIAAEFSLRERQILRYNDCERGSRPETNSIVYIQGKRGKAPRGNDFHIAKENESLWSIAQWYGVRLNALYRLNNMRKGDEPYPGQRISLRKKQK